MSDQVLKNILAIRKKQGLSQESMALEMELAQSHYGKIERGLTVLTVKHIEKIAEIFKIRIIDIYTYPRKFIDPEEKGAIKSYDNDIEAILQIKLRADKKDQVLRFVFGKNNLEILNK
jgi:transcriptional regulator with XRE-family HTH domain